MDGSPLPELIVVRLVGEMPLGPEEGITIHHVGNGASTVNDQARIDFDVRDWPRQSILRVFPKNRVDNDWIRIVSERGVSLEAT